MVFSLYTHKYAHLFFSINIARNKSPFSFCLIQMLPNREQPQTMRTGVGRPWAWRRAGPVSASTVRATEGFVVQRGARRLVGRTTPKPPNRLSQTPSFFESLRVAGRLLGVAFVWGCCSRGVWRMVVEGQQVPAHRRLCFLRFRLPGVNRGPKT